MTQMEKDIANEKLNINSMKKTISDGLIQQINKL